jgi:glycosyltransferase involved in cell wall biosynthesis
MGVPVVTTSLGCEGIGGVSGRDYLVADHDESFAEAVLRLLDDWQLRRTIAENARKFVTENYAWESIYDRLDAAISDVLSGTPAFRGVEVGR